MNPTTTGFGAIRTAEAKVLVLGTLPGQVSLARNEYYANARNVFWRLMGDVLGVDATLPYSDRTRHLKERGVALWDVCEAAHRPGSLDGAIDHASVKPNDFAALFAACPQLQMVCFNGAKAAQLFTRRVPEEVRSSRALRYETLPSTSPAHAAMRYEDKLARWSILREVLE